MATTTNYGWTTPDDTALVKDGASAIRSLGTSVDTTTKALNPGTTAGDLDYYTASTTKSRIAIGTNGQVLTSNGSVPSWQTPASGAITWTERLAGAGTAINTVGYNGTNLYVAAGNSGVLYSSPDGKTWTSRTSGFGANTIQHVAFGNGLWVAVGANGTLTTSPDGTTWTARTANFATNQLNHVIYANSLWVAVGADGGINNTGGLIYSSDGTTWTRKSQTITVGTDYYMSAWNGTNWIIGASSATNNYLYATTPSGTWTAGTSGVSTNISYIVWDGTRHIVVQGQSVAYSTSLTLGTTSVYTNLASASQDETTKRLFQLYSNVLYRFSIAMQTYVPVSTLYPSLSAPVLLPTTTITTASALSSGMRSSFVGAAGIIVTGTSGAISTSF
jgi:hypothetical protein